MVGATMSKLKESFKLFSLCFLVSCVIVFLIVAVVSDFMPTAKQLEPLAQVVIDRMGL